MSDRDLVKKAILGSMIGTIGGGMVGERVGKMTGYNFAGPVGGALLGGYVGEKMMEPRKRREPKQALDLLRESLAKRSSADAEQGEPADRDKALDQNKRVLRKAVSKFGPLYKTKGAQGWDVLAESVATDDQAPGGGQA